MHRTQGIGDYDECLIVKAFFASGISQQYDANRGNQFHSDESCIFNLGPVIAISSNGAMNVFNESLRTIMYASQSTVVKVS